MSHAEHEVAHGHGGHPPAEEDWVPTGRIVMVAVAALVVFLVGSIAAGLGMRSMQRKINPDGPAPMPAEAGKAKIGMVEQRLFENSNQNTAWKADAERRLGSYGWVDREKGVAHIPIDVAMDLVEKGKRP